MCCAATATTAPSFYICNVRLKMSVFFFLYFSYSSPSSFLRRNSKQPRLEKKTVNQSERFSAMELFPNIHRRLHYPFHTAIKKINDSIMSYLQNHRQSARASIIISVFHTLFFHFFSLSVSLSALSHCNFILSLSLVVIFMAHDQTQLREWLEVRASSLNVMPECSTSKLPLPFPFLHLCRVCLPLDPLHFIQFGTPDLSGRKIPVTYRAICASGLPTE